MSDLHSQIMNLQCHPDEGAGVNYALAFRMGHKQARHNAAELVQAATEQSSARIAELEKKLADMDNGCACVFETFESDTIVKLCMNHADREKSARAEERAKVMKEVSETPAFGHLLISPNGTMSFNTEEPSYLLRHGKKRIIELIERPTFKE